MVSNKNQIMNGNKNIIPIPQNKQTTISKASVI